MTAGPELYPLLLTPALHRRVWGGTRLLRLHRDHVADAAVDAAVDAAALQPTEPVGESWLLGPQSVVANGAFAGRSLAELAQQLGGRLVGREAHARYGARLPLLLKLLDAAQPLSVQVHPGDEYALTHEAASGHLGKSEAWYVLDAAQDAAVLWGLKAPQTPERVRAAAEDGSLPGLMQRVSVTAGDVVVNPAGTLHAVGAGILLFEIQQASDLTYRLYDHGRVGADGRPRQLHMDRALAVADLGGARFVPPAPRPLDGGWVRLALTPEFTLDKLALPAPGATPGQAEGHVAPTSMQTLTVVRGRWRLTPAESATRHAFEPLYLGEGQTVLLPADLPCGYELWGEGEVLRGAVVPECAGQQTSVTAGEGGE